MLMYPAIDPVALQGNVLGLQVGQHVGVGQGGLLVVLAGHAPGGSEVYKHGAATGHDLLGRAGGPGLPVGGRRRLGSALCGGYVGCLLYTSDAADE